VHSNFASFSHPSNTLTKAIIVLYPHPVILLNLCKKGVFKGSTTNTVFVLYSLKNEDNLFGAKNEKSKSKGKKINKKIKKMARINQSKK
jgi:hypothetical protein